jgi:2,3-bisphosphoglycerate-independent phosphoglycerate mutase
MSSKKVALIILDGWGKGKGDKSDAIANAKKPYFDYLIKHYPNGQLLTCGEHVGLPDGQMGNSEVGHLNIGAGRVVYQELVRINKAIREKTLDSNEVLLKALKYAKENGKSLHFMGLVSDGGVHSSQEHLHRLCEIATDYGLNKIFVHAFTDGRDCDPKSGLSFIEKLDQHLKNTNAKIATIIGRYYAMDRDKRWERVKIAYDLLVNGTGEKFVNPVKAVNESYLNGVTDEFIKPICISDQDDNPIATIKEGDAVVCFNFRTDRCREITQVLTQLNMQEHGMNTIALHYVTMTNYDSSFKNVQVIFEKDNLKLTLGEVLSDAGKTQIRIAETEKYPHVTFFFSGGREQEYKGESRILVNSPKVATYDLQPEMSAPEIAAKIGVELEKGNTDFICLNFANPDMVGHTGVYSAIVKAIETVDICLKQVVEAGLKQDYSFIITADHGNADYALNEDGSPNTAHSLNPVPCIIIDKDVKDVRNGKLADLAPTILKLMDIKQPMEMDGVSLV